MAVLPMRSDEEVESDVGARQVVVARHLLEDFTAPDDDAAEYIDSLEKENKRLRYHHHEVMEDLRAQSETIARLIQKSEIDRSALSTVAGIIGRTTWREINVG